MTTAEILKRWATAAVLAALAGCSCDNKKADKAAYMGDFRPQPLGTISDPIWQAQEENAEASDFVVHEHEWVGNSVRLNAAGMEHVKQIAARACETPFPVLVERCSMSVQEGTKHAFPVNGNEDLDQQRRQLLVQALTQLGVQNAECRVLVAPALTPGFQEFEGEQAYIRGFSGNANGFGNGWGGMGGFGGGGFGGGFF